MQNLPQTLQWQKYCYTKSWHSFKMYCNLLCYLGFTSANFYNFNTYWICFIICMFLFYCCKHSNDSMLVNKKQFCKHSSCKTKECYTCMESNLQSAMGEKVFSWRENSKYTVNENTTKSEKRCILKLLTGIIKVCL